jgi:RimK family alpha-L-glutamate ligase
MHPSPKGLRIVVFAEPHDSHAHSIRRKLASLGASTRIVRLQQCGFDTTMPDGLAIPGGVPDAVLVRTVSDGSFEAVTKRLGVLHALRERGVLVWNDARVVERCVDKSMTSFLLAQAGIATPPTWTCESRRQAEEIVRQNARDVPLVLKPLFGSQGRGLRLIKDMADLPDEKDVSGVYYLQRFVEIEGTAYHDYRVFIVNGRAVAAMRRASTHWITNVKQGGEPCAVLLDAELSSIAVRAAHAVGASFCGVDVIRNRLGDYQILEVNSMPAWAGLQKVVKVNIAGEIASALFKEMQNRQSLRRAV